MISMLLSIVTLCVALGAINSCAMDPNYPSPARAKLAQEIAHLDKQIKQTNQKEMMYFSFALMCAGLLYYCPEQHAKGFNTLYLTEALLRNGVLVVGGNCLRQFYDLRKKRIGYSNEKQELQTKLNTIRHNSITNDQKNKNGALQLQKAGKNKATSPMSINLSATKHRHNSMPAISPRNSFDQDDKS